MDITVSGSYKHDKNTQYFGLIIFALIISSGLVIMKLRSIQPEIETEPENLVDFRTVQLIIETDKEEYELGESIDIIVYIINPTAEDVWILPIANYNINVSSRYDPVFSTYAVSVPYPQGSYIKILANGRYAIDHQVFKLDYPGPFIIECMGMKKTVNVTGAKWETLGSEKFYIELRPVYSNYQMGLIESIETLFVNEYPYDVKVAHPDKAEFWFEPEGKYPGGRIDWELVGSELIVPANSSYELYQIDKVGVENCVLFFKTLGQTVSLEIWIEG